MPEDWDRPFPFGFPAAIESAGSVAAPLLPGFSFEPDGNVPALRLRRSRTLRRLARLFVPLVRIEVNPTKSGQERARDAGP